MAPKLLWNGLPPPPSILKIFHPPPPFIIQYFEDSILPLFVNGGVQTMQLLGLNTFADNIFFQKIKMLFYEANHGKTFWVYYEVFQKA